MLRNTSYSTQEGGSKVTQFKAQIDWDHESNNDLLHTIKSEVAEM